MGRNNSDFEDGQKHYNNRNEEFEPTTLYHGSHRELKEGQIIRPGSKLPVKTSNPVAYATYDKTIAEDRSVLSSQLYGGKPSVYEVEKPEDAVVGNEDSMYTVTSKKGFRVVRKVQ